MEHNGADRGCRLCPSVMANAGRGKSRIQVYALSRLGYKTEAVISSPVAPAHPLSVAFLCNACVR